MNNRAIPALSEKTVGQLDPRIHIPTYDRNEIKTGIVHIGPSAFFRGHLAVYVDDLLSQGYKDLGICAVSLKTSNVRDALRPQDYLYSVVEQGVNGNRARIIGSIKDIIVAQEDPKSVLSLMSSPDIKLVSLTVTQGGYYYKNGNLDFEDQSIKDDLNRADEPRSTVGLLVTTLERRMKAGIQPFTVMSCDNFVGNATILRSVVLAYAAQRSQKLHDWIAEKVPFPATMVDRIVPSTKQEDIIRHQVDYAMKESWPIYTEEFRDFAIESVQGSCVPDFSRAAAHIAPDVSTHELRKIRLLNGIHMALGMVGRMAGYEYAHEAIADPQIRTFIVNLMDDQEKTLKPIKGVDYGYYRNQILQRLDNPAMNDSLSRLARNGMDKMDSRFLSSLRDAYALNTPRKHLAMAVALWIEYLKRHDEKFGIEDAKAVAMGLPEKARQSGATGSMILSNRDIFGMDLTSSKAFHSDVETALAQICNNPKNILEVMRDFNGSATSQYGSGRGLRANMAPTGP